MTNLQTRRTFSIRWRNLILQEATFLSHANICSKRRSSTTLDELTETEIEILKLTAQGKSVKEIAYDRNSSYHTINTHKRNIFRKLGINTSYEATRYAMRAGLVDLVEYYI